MSILISCNTFLQLIIAIMLKKEFFSQDEVDIILSDYTKGMDQIANRLENEHFFRKVVFFNSKDYFHADNGKLSRKEIYNLLMFKLDKVKNEITNRGISLHYDSFIYNNFDLLNSYLFDLIRNENSNCKQYVFEEGVLGYNKYLFTPPINRAIKVLKLFRKLQQSPCLQDHVEAYYCLYPEIINGRHKEYCKKIPPITDNSTIYLLGRIFDYDPSATIIKQRFMYFGGSEDIDGVDINEPRVVERIADIVGRENLIVKMHPRDTRDIYEKMGITVYRGKPVPWEIMAITNDYSEKVFMTVSSSSLITGNVFKNEPVNALYLYPIVSKGKPDYVRRIEELGIKSTIDSLKQHGICKNFKIISTDDDLTKILKSMC